MGTATGDRSPDTCRERLEQLVTLAVGFHGCSRSELSRRLGRNSSNMIPESGLPKVDYLVALADVLDWPVDHVVDWIIGDDRPNAKVEANSEYDAMSFEELNALAYEQHNLGNYRVVARVGHTMLARSTTPLERAKSWLRICIAEAGQGQYGKTLDAARCGLQEPFEERIYEAALKQNLALGYHALEQDVEASAIAGSLISELKSIKDSDLFLRFVKAEALYVCGDCARRTAVAAGSDHLRHAQRAKEFLTDSINRFVSLAEHFQPDSCLGVANTCRGSLLEVSVMLGDLAPRAAIDIIVEEVTSLESDGFPIHDKLESYGWWCIFGANIVLRVADDPKFQQQTMLSLINAADQIARRLDNWALRRHVYAIEFNRRKLMHETLGVETEWTLSRQELNELLGSIGRFPSFEAQGRSILNSAVLINRRGKGAGP